MRVVDITNDPGFASLKVVVSQFPQVGELCKTAELSRDEFENLSDDSFAWPEERKFPVHTREHAALSVGYAKLAEYKIPEDARKNLEWAAKAYGLSEDLYQQNGQVKEAGGVYLHQEKKRFRIRGPEDVKEAEYALHDRVKELSVPEKAHVFSNLNKVAEYYGIELEPRTKMYGGAVVTDVGTLRDLLEIRGDYAEKIASPLENTYREMAESFRGVEGFIANKELQTKLAAVIDEADRRVGLDTRYSKRFPDPILTVFNTDKVAEERVNVAGVPLPVEKLRSIPLTFWQDALGPDIVREVAPNGELDVELLKQVLPTLPSDMNASIAPQLRAYA